MLIGAPSAAVAQHFSGPYLGIDVGRQHYIGGSLVNGIDTLQEDSRTVASVFGGWRGEFRRFVIGGELGLGRTDGTLRLDDANATVDYANDSQRHWAVHAGPRLGSGTLLFGYLSEVTRHFDVTITSAGRATTQKDQQGMLRFGGGIEQALTKRLHLRLAVGTSRADFGDQPTNLSIGRRFEISAGLLLQF